MGVLDKFLDIMKLSDDEYEDDFFDDEDDFDDEKPKKSLFKKEKKYDFDDDDDDFYESKTRASRTTGSMNKVTPMRQPARKASMEVCVIKPTNVDDAREITETLLSGSTVILNLEGMDLEIAQRIIDYRTEIGGYVAVEELLNVEGIGEHRLLQLKELVTTGG